MEPGDTVQLKSGGPLMTIQKIEKAKKGKGLKRYFCRWFYEAQLEKNSFYEHEILQVKQ